MTGKRIAIALALSLALNVFLGGFLAARAVHRAQGAGHEGGAGPFLGPRGLMRGGKGPAADAVHDLMHRRGDDFRAERGQLRDAQRAVRTALAAEPFDPEALTRALAELRASTARSQQLMHTALVELARTLPPEQRRELGHRWGGFGRDMAGHGGM